MLELDAALADLVTIATKPEPAEGAGPGNLPDDSQDVGGIVHFEHIQFFVDDLDTARIFWCDALGFTEDPGTTSEQRGGFGVLWFSLGREQVHVVKNADKCREQRFAGVVSLVVERPADQMGRLRHAQQALAGTAYRFEEAGGHVLVVSPWGQRVVLSQPPFRDFPLRRGMPCVHLLCHPGTARTVAGFYERFAGARVAVDEGRATVWVGPGQRLVFCEHAALGDVADQGYMQCYRWWHVALYVAGFSRTYRAAERLRLVFNKHPYFDKVHDMQQALGAHQFRIQAISELQGEAPELVAGRTVYFFENELRSMHHPKFMRALYNRLNNDFDVPDTTHSIV